MLIPTIEDERRTIRMLELHEQGVISDQVMMLYGISGDLPERNFYDGLTPDEKRELWAERMERRLGENWRRRFENLPHLLQVRIEQITHDWLKEGF